MSEYNATKSNGSMCLLRLHLHCFSLYTLQVYFVADFIFLKKINFIPLRFILRNSVLLYSNMFSPLLAYYFIYTIYISNYLQLYFVSLKRKYCERSISELCKTIKFIFTDFSSAKVLMCL